MKKFIIKIVFFLLPVTIFMVLLDNYLSDNFKNDNKRPGEIEVWNDIYNGNIDAEIAIYGSSRSWIHINPKIIKDSLNIKAYNFGIDGHNFWLQYLRNIEYLKYNKQPELIVMSVDVFTLAKRKDLYEMKQFLPYMLWNKNIIEYTSSYNGFGIEDYYLPLLRYYGKTRGLHLTSANTIKEPYRTNGYRGIQKEWNTDLSLAKEKMDQFSINIDSKSMDLFEQFLLECKTNKIKVILVYTPEYIEGQEFVKNRKEIITLFNEFSNKHNLLFLDYSNDEISLHKDYFYNASHLNKKGSELFTSKLSAVIKSQILKNEYK